MSRLPVDVPESEPDNEFLCTFVEELPIRARDMGEATMVDKMLSQVLKYIQEGWPGHLTESLSELKPYFNHKEHLFVEQGCILLGYRVVILVKFCDRLLNELHRDHPGICKMKALALCYLWWSSLGKDREAKVKTCSVC